MRRYGLELSSGPATEPLTTAQAKAHLRVDGSDEDTLIDALIKTARKFVENYTGRALITQTWILWLDRIEEKAGAEPWWDGVREGPASLLYPEVSREVLIPKAPLQSVTSITTFAPDDTDTEFAASNYFVDSKSTKGRVVLKDGVIWPTNLREANAIKIEFEAGYGAAAAVPDDILQAMKMLIAHWFENREAVSENSMAEVPFGVKVILDQYRIVEL